MLRDRSRQKKTGNGTPSLLSVLRAGVTLKVFARTRACYRMSDWKPNVTVAAVIEHGGRFLLVEEQTVAGIRLNQPAGHLEPGETLVQACVREALEETAHHVEVVGGIGIYLARFVHDASATDVTYLRFAFACRLASREGGAFDAARRLDQGILSTHWLPAEGLRARQGEHRSPLVMKVVDDYLAGQRFDPAVLQADASITALNGLARAQR